METRGKEGSEKLGVFAHLSSLLDLSLLKCVCACLSVYVCVLGYKQRPPHILLHNQI